MPEQTVLDNPARMKQIDTSGMLTTCLTTPKHYGDAAKLADRISLDYQEPFDIIVAGMGGSAIGGELFKDWARDRVSVPIEVNREYSLPAYAGKKTLVFVVSYSGETEEALSVFLDAFKRRCMMFCIASGGALIEMAQALEVPFLRIPPGIIAPRAALPYLFLSVPIILERTGLFSGFKAEIPDAIKTLETVSTANSPEKPANGNFAKKLAQDIGTTMPVIYGFGFYKAVATRLKQDFNENSKTPAKYEFFPELNHNEIVGWENAKKQAEQFSTILIRDKSEPAEIRQRIEATKEIIQKESVKTYEVWSEGRSRLARMSSTILVGNLTSIYLALAKGIDPTPVKTISILKEKVKQTGLREKAMRELQRLAK